MVLPNPYSPGATPRFLIGRDPELADIASRRETLLQTGRVPGPPLVFTAPRGLGKTSLLRRASEDALAEGFATAWVSCVRGEPMLTDLALSVAQALREVGSPRTKGSSRLRLKQVQVEVGVPGVKSTTGFEARPEAAVALGQVGSVADLLREAAHAVRDQGGAGLILLVDELHAPTLRDMGVLWNAVQNLTFESTPNPLMLVGAGLPSTPGHITKAATFGERSTFRVLPRLDAATATRALLAPAAELGVPWKDPAIEAAEAAATGYPYLVQLIGAEAWNAAAPEPGAPITLAHVRAGQIAATRQLQAMFEARWAAAASGERDFMAAMAHHPEQPVPRAAIAEALHISTRSLSDVRNRLIDRGIVESAGYGTLRFTLPGFGDYIRDEAPQA